jgi:hypothetical protein
VLFLLNVPKFGTTGSKTEFITIYPKVIEAKWTRNNHLVADELTVSVPWKFAGVDPRFIKQARCAFTMWDENFEALDQTKHLRFEGVCKKATRKIGNNGWSVDMTFHDYTTMFINMKPFPSDGMPEWSDTLQTAWEKICDHVGWRDPSDENKIVSSVTALRNRLRIIPPSFASKTLGGATHERFLKMAKPSPPHRCDAWAVWQYLCTMLGLVTFIRGTECFVMDTNELYTKENAPLAIFGQNITELEEEADTDVTKKGILLRSFDPVAGRVLEARYPLPGDERIKTKRSAVSLKSDGGAEITANEVSGEYDEFEYHHIVNQEALEAAAKMAYDQFSRQEMEGGFHTPLMRLPSFDGESSVDVLALKAGDAVRVVVDQQTLDVLATLGSVAEQYDYLVNVMQYDRGVAELIVANFDQTQINSPVFHVKSISVDFGEEKFNVEVKYHNVVNL